MIDVLNEGIKYDIGYGKDFIKYFLKEVKASAVNNCETLKKVCESLEVLSTEIENDEEWTNINETKVYVFIRKYWGI